MNGGLPSGGVATGPVTVGAGAPAAADVDGGPAAQRDLLLAVSRITSGRRHVTAITAAVLAEVCERTGWAYGEVWVRDPVAPVLRLSPVWHGRGSFIQLSRLRAVNEAARHLEETEAARGVVAEVAGTGRPLWAPRLEGFLPERAAQVRAAGLEGALAVPAVAAGEVEAVVVFLLAAPQPEDERLVDTVAAAALQLGTLLEQRRAVEAAQRMERMYRFAAQVNLQLLDAGDPREVMARACTTAVEAGGLVMAWAGEVDRAAGVVHPVAVAGSGGDYLDGIRITVDTSPSGKGPTGTAARLGVHVVSSDIARDPRMGPWRDRLLGRGFRSSAAFPIRRGGETVAVLSLYSGAPGFFDAEMVGICDRLVTEISFVLERLGAVSVRAGRRHRRPEPGPRGAG